MENSNAKVYLQYELEVAGFDPDLLVQVSPTSTLQQSAYDTELQILHYNV